MRLSLVILTGCEPWAAAGHADAKRDLKFPSLFYKVTPPVKARSGHILLETKRSYRDLVRVYPEVHRRICEANRPFAKETEPLLPDVLLEENLRDLRADRKPIGYNRQDAFGMRLIFPILETKRTEFYVAKPARCQEVVQVTEQISQLLRRRGIKHAVEYDRLPLGPPRALPGLPIPGAPTGLASY